MKTVQMPSAAEADIKACQQMKISNRYFVGSVLFPNSNLKTTSTVRDIEPSPSDPDMWRRWSCCKEPSPGNRPFPNRGGTGPGLRQPITSNDVSVPERGRSSVQISVISKRGTARITRRNLSMRAVSPSISTMTVPSSWFCAQPVRPS